MTKNAAVGRVQHKRPLVVLLKPRAQTRRDGVGSYWASIAEDARFMGWDILDTRYTWGQIPENLTPDGIITAMSPEHAEVKQLLDKGVPVVRRDTFGGTGNTIVPTVLPDVAGWGRLAAEHFAERGIRDVGYIGRDPWSGHRGLYDAFAARAYELDCRCHLIQLTSDPDETKEQRDRRRREQLKEWLAKLPKPAGVMTFSDDRAANLCTVCLEAGLSVPDDIAVLGIGNAREECELAPVPLSSIDTAERRRAQLLVQLLWRLMNGETPPSEPVVVQPNRVVTRRSTDILAVRDPNVARALHFMWGHSSENISVDAIANATGINRRTLERAFRKHLGRSISVELRRKRLECCCDLLRESDMTVADIAAVTGFNSADYLHMAFRKAFNTTPGAISVPIHVLTGEDAVETMTEHSLNESPKDPSPSMHGDELASKLKSSVIFKSDNGVVDDSLKLPPSKLKWWRDAKFGMFIHWGLYAIPASGEWYMHNQKVPADEYAKLADEFAPDRFDADKWVQAGKATTNATKADMKSAAR